jgi:hypothetical protein
LVLTAVPFGITVVLLRWSSARSLSSVSYP